ncbi:MAG: sulfatase-like hydrolase/transferase [Verrucomicrobiaceae bacterium]|nr:sulfatase-like hydrolase/transferase [Verrucomicrobiaceae bacterium]
MKARLTLVLLFPLASLIPPSAPAADRPNIVWIVSEDNSKHYLKLFDEHGTATPHIEALAAEGITFTRAFSHAPVCSVARSTLATGCYAPRLGLQFHRGITPASLPTGLRPLSEQLRAAGYYTSNRSKEDYNFAKSPATWDDSSKNGHWRNRPDPAMPFFHMQSHSQSHESSLHFDRSLTETEKTDHDPAAVTLPPYFPDTPLFRYTYARYLDRIRLIDDIVGETIAKLREDGLLEDTFVFYFGDHGGVLPRSKGYLYEGGLHVPLVVRVPEKWKHLVDLERGSEQPGFVGFIDFAPTVLHLAGLAVPGEMDGRPFLGAGISRDEVARRNTTLGHSDRFDEKYELVRSLRVGDWKYLRHYQPHYPDALQNNYRYRMAAYREWRDLYDEGRLGSDQRQFFEAKSPERLFDLRNDPHELANLAADPAHRAKLLEMRAALRKKLKSLPDLGFIPENILVREAMDDPVGYGKARAVEIAALIDTADLMLHPFAESEAALREALDSDGAWIRYWAAAVCAAYGEDAAELAEPVRDLLDDPDPMVRVRAVEFLALLGEIDPRGPLVAITNGTDDPVEKLIALQSAAFFHNHPALAFPFDADAFDPVPPGSGAERRILYFRGDWIGKTRRKK